jgi:diguanylate cyclase (GGDEF)-like protein
MTEKHTGLGPQISQINWELKTPSEGETGIPVIDAANKIEKLIYNDTLTNFENRRGLNRYKENLKPDQYPQTMVTFDLDNLKKINDDINPETGGHKNGDEYILSYVKFVNETFPNITKFRLGGDEFVIPVFNLDPKVLETLDSKLADFNEREREEKKEQYKNKLEVTYASDTASSSEDFYKALDRSDQKMMENKKNKKNQQNLLSNPSTRE